ncbi:MAG: hypothetical protein VXY83_03415 [Pseudomonadota bacterium]|nr:hypothetical protein [Pseudomonadota bacterium]
MLKLLTTMVLGAFLIYGLDDLGVITAEGFEAVDKPENQQQATAHEAPKPTSRFTDRIVQKRTNKEVM